MISFGPFRPDAASPNSGYAMQALGVVPKLSGGRLGYGPFPSLVTAADAEALGDAPRGHISLVKFDGTYAVFFATETTIEELDSTFQFTSIATGLSVTPGDDMSFCHFGQYLLSSNTSDGFYAYNVEVPAGNNAVSDAPAARYIFSANNVVVALDCDGNNRRMQTSGIGDHTAWDSKGADGKTFEDGGALICGADLQNGAAILFQSNTIRLMQFGGAPGGALYRISKIADGIGSVGARSMIADNGQAFFLASDGFYRYQVGGVPEPIGAEKVNRWFFDQVTTSDLPKVQGWIDPQNKLVGWLYKRSDVVSESVFEDCLVYDWQLKEWSTLSVEAAFISRIATAGYTVDGPYADVIVDDNDTLVDDRLYQGGEPVLAALDGDLKYSTFSGSSMAAVLETSELTDLRHRRVTGAHAIVDTDAATVQLGFKRSLQDAFGYGSAVSLDDDGFAPVDEAGKVYAFRMNIPAGSSWSNAEGVDGIEGVQGGPR